MKNTNDALHHNRQISALTDEFHVCLSQLELED